MEQVRAWVRNVDSINMFWLMKKIKWVETYITFLSLTKNCSLFFPKSSAHFHVIFSVQFIFSGTVAGGAPPCRSFKTTPFSKKFYIKLKLFSLSI
jgi:hypothetical protein